MFRINLDWDINEIQKEVELEININQVNKI